MPNVQWGCLSKRSGGRWKWYFKWWSRMHLAKLSIMTLQYITCHFETLFCSYLLFSEELWKKNKKTKKQNKKKQKQIWIITVFILKLIRDRFQLEILRLGKVLTTNNPSLIFDFCSWKSHLMYISSKVRRKKLLMLSVIIITKGQMLKMLKKILLEFSTPLTLYWLD